MNGEELPASLVPVRIIKPNLDVYYPQVSNLINVEIENIINDNIRKKVYEIIGEQGYYANPNKVTINGTFEIKTNERGLLSLSIINNAYSGGIHGLTVIKSLTFDTKTGKEYKLEELFKSTNYLKILTDIVKKQIKERDIYLLGEFEGITSDQDYYIADKALVLYYQPYEITPHAFGIPYFPISVYRIEVIIEPYGPLGILSY